MNSPPHICQITGTTQWLFSNASSLSPWKIRSEIQFFKNLNISKPCQVCLFAVKTHFDFWLNW